MCSEDRASADVKKCLGILINSDTHLMVYVFVYVLFSVICRRHVSE